MLRLVDFSDLSESTLVDELTVERSEFRWGKYRLSFQEEAHFLGLIENYVLDIYRTSMLKLGDTVLDLGAGIGDFAILASNKVGSMGLVVAVEPSPTDYNLMTHNIWVNDCRNVLAINKGVGNSAGVRKAKFADHTFTFAVDTLCDLLGDVEIAPRFDFVKIDIEGFERELFSAKSNTEVLCTANHISLELHGTKDVVDSILTARGYRFDRLTKRRLLSKALAAVLSHPAALYSAYKRAVATRPHLISKMIRGVEITGGGNLLVGTYVKVNSNFHVCTT